MGYKQNMLSTLIATTFVLSSISQQIKASGVFELEFIKFEVTNLPPRLSTDENYDQTSKSNESQHKSQDVVESRSPLQVFVCLKPAFTSQLDGPCTYGNASTTLIRESSLNHDPSIPAITTPTTMDTKQHPQISNQKQTGSLSTNLVRIPFTFRWTKSFTIIITGEQVQAADADNQRATSARLGHGFGNQYQHVVGDGDSNLENDSANTNRLVQATNYLPSSHQQQISAATNKLSAAQPIYRHVLTENEVLPNLELNSNKPWASRFSHTLNSSLEYKFRIYCSLNYYGDGCTAFCRARDDHFGHYNCSSMGQKICLEGWHGIDCDRAKCRLGCNQQHGYCDKPDTCTCLDGWTGSRCDECKTHPKCKNGYCLTKNDCLCHKGWGGQLCDLNLNYCGTHEPCKNNGSCQNIAPGGYKCTCPDGFTGPNCEVNQNSTQLIESMTRFSAGCTMNPCLNGGICYGYDAGIPVAMVATDAITELADNKTETSEKHDESERIYRCQCVSGWTGDYCQWPDTDLISFQDIVADAERQPSPVSTVTTTTTISTTHNYEDLDDIQKLNPVTDKIPPIFSAFIEAPKQEQVPVHLDMRHLISGVVIASVVGVLLAFLFLAWCCLVAIEQNRFSFIQMNVIRGADTNRDEVHGVSSTLRRMHEKIRDSFRLSRNRIKPDTKLSIENVLKPPPTYEESSNQQIHKSMDYLKNDPNIFKANEIYQKSHINSNLVRKEAFKQESYEPSISSTSESSSNKPDNVTDAQLNCPRHGHLYRKENRGDVIEQITYEPTLGNSTSIHQTPARNSHFTTHVHISSTRQGSSHHTHLGPN